MYNDFHLALLTSGSAAIPADKNITFDSGWLTTIVPVIPGEVIVLELMVFDVSDRAWDSLVLLDNFRWLPDPAALGTDPGT